MLASLVTNRGRSPTGLNNNSPPRMINPTLRSDPARGFFIGPLENVSLDDDMPPPLEPLDGRDEEGMPELESVSNSSEEEEDGVDSEGDDTDWSGRQPDLEELTRDMHTGPWSRTLVTPPDTSQGRMIIDVDDDNDDHGSEEAGEDARVDGEEIQEQETMATPLEPPFVTDGRGRVVWTSSSSSSVPASVTTAISTPATPRSPPIRQTSSGFTTDGRGRVIGTTNGRGRLTEDTNAEQQSQEPRPRSFLERVWEALF